MINCRIMDDQYGENIYNKLSNLRDDFNYPIKWNILSPIAYLDKINDWDIILLDNFFPWETWEEPLWETFLWWYINRQLRCKIICISDYWRRLSDEYLNRNYLSERWDILWFVPDKNGETISKLI